jgi:hypothetical protein
MPVVLARRSVVGRRRGIAASVCPLNDWDYLFDRSLPVGLWGSWPDQAVAVLAPDATPGMAPMGQGTRAVIHVTCP